MSRPAHCRVFGRFEKASQDQQATLTLDRNKRLILVRPLRSRKVYELPAATVAEIIVQRIIRAEIAERRRQRRPPRLRGVG